MSSLEEAKKLISIESVTGNEGPVIKYLEKRFRQMGCRVRTFEAAPGRPNIYAEFGGREGDRPALLFHGHLDTVPGYGMPDPFSPVVRDGKLYGRGSVDQKGGVAAVISAFNDVLAGPPPERPIAFVGVIDEESEHRGSMALAAMGVDADFAIITEPSNLVVGVGCKGTLPILLEARGKAAHGCRPWLGKNAVVAGMEAAKRIMDDPLPTIELEGIGSLKASINLGKMEGGEAYNIVPDRCSLWFDRRLLPGESQDEVLQRIDELLAGLPEMDGFSFSRSIARPDWNWDPIKERGLLPAMSDLSSSHISTLREIHRSCLNRESEIYFTDGYHEMDFLVNDLGIDTVQYGPGLGALCHTDNEYIEIQQLEECRKVYGALIKEMGRGDFRKVRTGRHD